ncbi:hypothetical protein F3608_07655 [Salmonella enterica subsp. diarizonae]|nr:hypothetical protein [Salmonella enterica subsp. diarizonae]
MQFNTNKVLTSIFFYGMVLVPGLLMVLNDKVGSNFIGIFFISTIILFLVVISGFNKLTISYSFLIFSVISFFLILFHFGLSSLLFQNGNTTFTKNITSLLFLFYILLACYFSSVAIDNITHQEFDRIVSKLFKLLIALGVLSSLFILSSSSTSKEMLFFTEPSHYALIVTIFYCYKISQKKLNLLYGIPLLFTALIVQNLTLIIGIVVAIAINYMRVKSMFIIMICVSSSCMLIAGILPIDKLSYYSQRLDISQESKNTSTLTLLSGYEQAYLALRDSYGLGYGLQNMGYANERGEFVSIIGRLRGGNTDSNLYDGGLFISKLIVEFGILGGIFFLYTLFLGVMRFKCNDKIIKFFSIVLIMSIIYFLLRGSGYFTPSAVMIFILIIYLVNKKNINKKMT